MLNRVLGRVIGAVAVLAALAGHAGAVTAPIVVVEVDSGKVIYSQGATDPWYPASITKLMTTYVALDMVRQGKVSLDTLLTISAQAAAEPPSKMGFKPGTQLTLDNALKIIMVKSANDVAWAIGENLGGSVDGFADMMNETARRIGMRESRWYNPNGLPEPRQWTSARDMAILGRALMRDFPDQQALFSISAIQFGKAVMANHNGLLGRYAGADGMKTGFICSGGFNVVASATRNGRRIITVVMGQPSARERDLKAADLFDYGFSQSAGWSAPTLEALPSSSTSEPPDMRPYICDRKKPMPVDEGQAAITSSAPAGADNAFSQLLGATQGAAAPVALATINSANMRGRSLPPRAPLQPIAVWTGSSPAAGAAALAQQEEEARNSKAAKLAAAKEKREAAREAAKQAKAEKAAKVRAAAVTAPHQHGKAGVPATTSAYTAVDGAEKKPTKVPAKAAVKSAPAAAAKPAAKAAAKPVPKKKSAAASE
ncbi:D-alanyl-D-alanine carboxypeptidase family protein [Methylobacterium sp. WL9]|uniref:D-alanyl-D-alanine carboxypeptidase family protein n=1 Tax=Methylobacterium sp. WL9 TaxID=2603898 RepID=UPI0011CC84BE|nr:D-alanyl-D-alanine carboxypeptidase family protein [Methylobacterium sp. WL9]TXN21807.1 D-alanyl-D-alanine carboxypeptidase [Methylobacterium sp. WL9]